MLASLLLFLPFVAFLLSFIFGRNIDVRFYIDTERTFISTSIEYIPNIYINLVATSAINENPKINPVKKADSIY